MNGTKWMLLAQLMGNSQVIDAGTAAMETSLTICSVVFFAAVWSA
jgi:hypothetical protein